MHWTKKLILVFLVSCLLAMNYGCQEDPRRTPPEPLPGPQGVSYLLSCSELECVGMDHRHRSVQGDLEMVTCEWDCVEDYSGLADVQVEVTFMRVGGGCWGAFDLNVEDGLCG